MDRFAAISEYIGDRIARCYGRDASVIYPPVDTRFFTPGGPRDDYFLAASRWVPYKRIDLIVESFRQMPDRRLIVVGDGPEAPRVRAAAGPNVEFVGEVARERLRELLRRARAFIFAAEEDFGILPVEAQACGTPVIAYRRGGVLETVRGLEAAQPTGVFFDEQILRGNRSRGATVRRTGRKHRPDRMPSKCRALRGNAFPCRVPGVCQQRMDRIRVGRSDNVRMARSVLKPYATLFAGVLRASDPVVTVAVGLAAYRAYLGSFRPPEHYVFFIAGGAFAVAALFPIFRLYQPQRGIGFADELRQLLLAWLLVAAITGIGIFATKTGDDYSRVWVIELAYRWTACDGHGTNLDAACAPQPAAAGPQSAAHRNRRSRDARER